MTAPGPRRIKGPKKTGRPRKLTIHTEKQITEKVCLALSLGSYLETAAAFAGIHRDTLHDWLRKGANQRSGVYQRFSDAVQEAMAQAHIQMLAELKTRGAASKDWREVAWRLSHRYKGLWGVLGQDELGPLGVQAAAPEATGGLEVYVVHIPAEDGDGAPTPEQPRLAPASNGANGARH